MNANKTPPRRSLRSHVISGFNRVGETITGVVNVVKRTAGIRERKVGESSEKDDC